MAIGYIVAIVAIAFIFDFINGFHDSANSIATAVAKTVGQGMIDVSVVDPNVILGGLVGAIVWNLITWVFGLPSSSSHALIGGYAGAAVAKAGFGAIIPGGWTKTLAFIVLSPVIGLALGFGLMVAVYWVFQRTPPGRVDRIFRVAQLASSAFFSLSHGANDAQKTMGIIVGLLVSSRSLFANETGLLRHLYVTTADRIPYWVEIGAYTAIALGTLFGGWRIVHTMASRITRLRPVGGFCAETGGALSILLATKFGIPVSTTHTITGSIVGVGATNRLSAVRWGGARRIVWAWLLTDPAAALIAAGHLPWLPGVS